MSTHHAFPQEKGAPADVVSFSGVYEEFAGLMQQFFGMDVKDIIIDAGHHAPGEAKNDAAVMEQAKNAGISLTE